MPLVLGQMAKIRGTEGRDGSLVDPEPRTQPLKLALALHAETKPSERTSDRRQFRHSSNYPRTVLWPPWRHGQIGRPEALRLTNVRKSAEKL
jgi:hypothetical protein